MEVNGTPVQNIPNIVLTLEPQKKVTLKMGSTVADSLSPGYVHEFEFSVSAGDEIAVAIQFLSPTAQRVSENVALVKPDGHAAGNLCEMSHILDGDTGIAFSCMIDQTGKWEMRVFGIEGESSGAYTASLERF
jgi:hypothetical protein